MEEHLLDTRAHQTRWVKVRLELGRHGLDQLHESLLAMRHAAFVRHAVLLRPLSFFWALRRVQLALQQRLPLVSARSVWGHAVVARVLSALARRSGFHV